MPKKLALPLVSILLIPSITRAEPMKFEQFKPLEFKDIPATEYKKDGTQLSAKVKSSASALILAFDTIRPLESLRWRWRCTQPPKVKDAEHEASKKGDDACLRIGLLLAGPAPSIPFFAPAWIKALGSMMKHPSDQMLYLVSGAKHPAGSAWKSPYSSSIENISVASKASTEAGWQEAEFKSVKKYSVAGLWVMADGDDTSSDFTLDLKDLEWSEGAK